MDEELTGRVGDGNSLAIMRRIANESLMRVLWACIFPHLASRTYEKYFAMKEGDTITIKKPYYGKLYEGRSISKSNLSPMVDQTVTMKIDEWHGFGLFWGQLDKELNINNFYNRYMKPHVEAMGQKFDRICAKNLVEQTAQHYGSPGTSLTQDVLPRVEELSQYLGIPDLDTQIAFNPTDCAQIIIDLGGAKGQSGKFSEEIVNDAISRAMMPSPIGSFRSYKSVHIPTQDVVRPASFGTPLVDSPSESLEGQDSIPTDGWGVAASTKVLNKGTIITIAGVYEVAPNSEVRRTGRLKQFTVTKDVTTGTGVNATKAIVPISPPINGGGATIDDGNGEDISLSQYQNVTLVPPDNAAITILGLPSSTGTKTYRQNILWNRESLQLASIRLSAPESAVGAFTQTDDETGLSMSAIQAYDFDEREEMLRCDALFLAHNIRPDFCVRMMTTEVDGATG